MRAIGWTLACVLLATSFPKSAISASIESVGVVRGNEHETGRAKVTKLLPVSKDDTADPDIQQLREFLDDLFASGGNVRGKFSIILLKAQQAIDANFNRSLNV